MTDSTLFDLIVIGTGAGGFAPAMKCAKAGWRVAIIDEEPFGGTCALRGCDPKKILIQAAELVDWHQRMSPHGVVGSAKIDWPALMRFKRSFTDPVSERREKALHDAGVLTLHGVARFVGRDILAIGDDQLRGKFFVVAAGARPAPLKIPGEGEVKTSTDFLELDALPRRIAFIGAGYISFELAHLSQLAGAHVTVVGRNPLSRFDQDLVVELVKRSRELGIEMKLGYEVSGVERIGDHVRVHCSAENGTEFVDVDYVVHGAGRIPNIDGLSLGTANIDSDPKQGVIVNEFLQSVSNETVYAAGDSTLPEGSAALTPVAGMEAAVVASNLLTGNHARADYRAIPSVVFTNPPLSSVGLTEAKAHEQQLDFVVNTADTSEWFTNSSVASPYGRFKTLIDTHTDRLLGAHLFGVHAEEVINLFALAMKSGIKRDDLKHLLCSYPTSSSDLSHMLG
ncbi:MAG: NAD(P)/FAD-dependent oxidoreductase [Gemmatimonadaceae bacterium]